MIPKKAKHLNELQERINAAAGGGERRLYSDEEEITFEEYVELCEKASRYLSI